MEQETGQIGLERPFWPNWGLRMGHSSYIMTYVRF